MINLASRKSTRLFSRDQECHTANKHAQILKGEHAPKHEFKQLQAWIILKGRSICSRKILIIVFTFNYI